MIVSKFNRYTGKYYYYDLDDYDFFTPMFDEGLHIDDTFDMEAISYKTCLYCHTEFSSRNKLFKHLGYHGINIRREREESGKTKRKRQDDVTKMMKIMRL